MIEGLENKVVIGANVDAKISGKGSGNTIRIGNSSGPSLVRISIFGNGNVVDIAPPRSLKNLHIIVGSHVPAHSARLIVGEGMSAESDCKLFLMNPENSITIGNDCMFSNQIIVRSSESPHLIFDLASGEYLDQEGHVLVGDHVWIGERAYLTKRARIGSGSIVAACGVVTRAFSEDNVLLAGNPAEVKRRSIRWERNAHHLDPESVEYQSVRKYRSAWQ